MTKPYHKPSLLPMYIVTALYILAVFGGVALSLQHEATKPQSSTLAIMRCEVTDKLTGEVKLKYTLRLPNKGCDQ